MTALQTVDLDLTAMTASLHTDKASFDRVGFQDVAEAYCIGNDINLVYTISPEVEISSRDWIGLYQVGWRSVDNYVCYEWSPIPTNHIAGKPSNGHIVFPAAKLPKDDGEFYQFCYITSKGQVCGLSSPFQFRKSVSFSSSLSDFVEIEDENGELLIIKSKTAYLDEQLKKANERCSMLSQDVKLLESEKEMLLLSKQELERKVSNLSEETGLQKKQIAKANDQITKLSREIECLKASISQLTEVSGIIDREKADLEKMLSEHKSNIAELQSSRKLMLNEKDALLGQIKSLEEEKALYQSHFTSTESALQAHVSRIEELQTQVTMSQAATVTATQQCENLENKVTLLSSQLEEVTANLQKSLTAIKLLEEQLDEAQLEILAGKTRELELKDELSASVSAQSQLSSDLEMSKTEAEALKGEREYMILTHADERKDLLRQLENAVSSRNEEKKENEKLLTEIADVRSKLEDTVTDSALYALQEANKAVKNRYLKLEKKVEQQQAILNESVAQVHNLEEEVAAGQSEIILLKERLHMGMEQYKEKVVECMKLQEACEKRKKATRNRSDEGNTSEDGSSIILRLQQQMQEVAAELDRRSARLAQMEESFAEEVQRRKAAEDKVREVEYELGSAKDELTRKSTVLSAMAEPLVPLPAPLQPQRIYPDVDRLEHLTSELSDASGESVAGADTQSGSGASAVPPDPVTSNDSAPQSLGDVLPKCPLCSMEFPPQTSTDFRTAHIDMHFVGEICPMCNEKFPHGSATYEPHVQSHFDGGSN